MKILGNIVWFIFGGFLIFFEYLFSSFALCLTIIGIPFGKEIIPTKFSYTPLYIILNILWLLLGGLVIAISHLLIGAVLCITIILIPFGLQHFKLMRLSLTPFGFDLR